MVINCHIKQYLRRQSTTRAVLCDGGFRKARSPDIIPQERWTETRESFCAVPRHPAMQRKHLLRIQPAPLCTRTVSTPHPANAAARPPRIQPLMQKATAGCRGHGSPFRTSRRDETPNNYQNRPRGQELKSKGKASEAGPQKRPQKRGRGAAGARENATRTCPSDSHPGACPWGT